MTEGLGDLQEATGRLERALIGAVLTSTEMPRVPLRREDFSVNAHGITWEAILAIVAAGKQPTELQLVWELAKTNRLDLAGGELYLAYHRDSTDCSEIDEYARMVREAARLRKVKRMGV